MAWTIYWRNWKTPAIQLGNQEADDVGVHLQMKTLIVWLTWFCTSTEDTSDYMSSCKGHRHSSLVGP